MAASAASMVQPSMNGSSGAPTLGIWIKWSMTENQVKPWFSAHWALAFTVSKISAGSEPNSQDGLWIPNCMAALLPDDDNCSAVGVDHPPGVGQFVAFLFELG